MGRTVLRRLGLLLVTLWVTSMVVFAVTRYLPGDATGILLGREADEAARAKVRQELGLDQPPPVQYVRWLLHFVGGDWGQSFSAQAPIQPVVLERLGMSLQLAGMVLLFAVPLAVFLGVIAGLYQHRLVDHGISVGTLSVVSLPEFVTGLVLIEWLGHAWKWLPASSAIKPGTPFLEAFPFLVLPALTATLVLLAYIARLVRAGVIEELKRQYVRTATLKGLPRRTVLVKHVLRNALMPTVTIIATSFGWLVSGLIVIENVFNYPGLGRLLVFAIENQDFPLLQAITMVVVVGVVLANLAADLLYALLNPRLRLG